MKLMRGAGAVLCCAALAVVGSVGGAAAAAPSAAGSSTPTTALQTGPATKQVTTTFVTLFNANDKNLLAREKLIENAPHYKAVFVKLFKSKVAKSNPTEAKVTAVTFPSTSACQAAVSVPACAQVDLRPRRPPPTGRASSQTRWVTPSTSGATGSWPTPRSAPSPRLGGASC